MNIQDKARAACVAYAISTQAFKTDTMRCHARKFRPTANITPAIKLFAHELHFHAAA
jgi:hypothetical protein